MLNGYKTYITAGIMALIAVAHMVLGVDIPGFTGDPGTLLAAALGLVFARSATAKLA